MWWESSDDWSAVVMDPGSKRARWGGRGAGAALPVGTAGLYRALGWRWLRLARVLWWWLSATGCMIRRKMRPSSDDSGKPHVHRPTSSWGILTSLISARRASQEGTMRSILEFRVATGNLEQLAWWNTLQGLLCQEVLVGHVNIRSRLQESPSLEIFRTHLDMAVSNLLQLTLFYLGMLSPHHVNVWNVLLTVWNRIGSVRKREVV